MSATEALTVATIINEAPVPPGMFVSKELPPRVSGEDLVIDVEGILRSVKKGGMLRRTQGELKRRLEEQILIQAVFLYSLL